MTGGTFPLAGDPAPAYSGPRTPGEAAHLHEMDVLGRVTRRIEWARAVPSGWSSHPEAQERAA